MSVQAKLSMVVRAWAAEGISIPVDWEALNFSPSALSEGALQSIRMKVASETRLGAAKLKANHSQRAAARGGRGPRVRSAPALLYFPPLPPPRKPSPYTLPLSRPPFPFLPFPFPPYPPPLPFLCPPPPPPPSLPLSLIPPLYLGGPGH